MRDNKCENRPWKPRKVLNFFFNFPFFSLNSKGNQRLYYYAEKGRRRWGFLRNYEEIKEKMKKIL